MQFLLSPTCQSSCLSPTHDKTYSHSRQICLRTLLTLHSVHQRGVKVTYQKQVLSLAVRKKNELGTESDVNKAKNSSL